MIALSTIAMLALADHADLVTFDGMDKETNWKWEEVNDPVMGGQSTGTFKIDEQTGVATFHGDCKIVPSLKAPGFCNAKTTDGGLFPGKHFKDDRAAKFLDGGLSLLVRSTVEFDGFKVTFAADTANPQFKSFKAPFNVTADGTWQEVFVPFTAFSNDWSSYTGRCDTKDPNGKQHVCCSSAHPEVCATKKNLEDISQMEIWAEGTEGIFNLQVKHIRASDAPAATHSGLKTAPKLTVGKWVNSCTGAVMKNLMYNMSGRPIPDGLPVQDPKETLADGICCDGQYRGYAETSGTFALPTVNLFKNMKQDDKGETTFYDPVCGIPLFIVPRGRTLADFQKETIEHGWPSFRDEEVVKGNVFNETGGTGGMKSKCGTHLGDNLPDDNGNRYCLDLACVSGRKAD
jgi:peptide methionine sulfoxide reductase MsrB